MKQHKTEELNLADMDETELLRTIVDYELDQRELIELLETLFDMWATALKFSRVVMQYGEDHHIEFTERFIEACAPKHGMTSEKMARMLKLVQRKRSDSSPSRYH